MTGEKRDFLRLGLRVLDEQLVDSAGRRCGRVEDIEFDAAAGRPAIVTSILCGATAWKRRLPPFLSELIPGDPRGLRRVPWDVISQASNEIELSCTEGELKYAAEGERAPLAVSQLIGARVVRRRGVAGRVADVICSRPSDDADERPWELHGLLIGREALLQRLGFRPLLQIEMQQGRFPDNFVEWGSVERMDEDGRLRAG